jgi:hypothetical protein
MNITQEQVNKLKTYTQDRQRNREYAYDRVVHNRMIEELVIELSVGDGE